MLSLAVSKSRGGMALRVDGAVAQRDGQGPVLCPPTLLPMVCAH